jgi:hypothetical protein
VANLPLVLGIDPPEELFRLLRRRMVVLMVDPRAPGGVAGAAAGEIIHLVGGRTGTDDQLSTLPGAT